MSIKPAQSRPVQRSPQSVDATQGDATTVQNRQPAGPAGAPTPPADVSPAAEPARVPASRQVQQEARLRAATDPTGLAMRRALEARVPQPGARAPDVATQAGPAGGPVAQPAGGPAPGSAVAPPVVTPPAGQAPAVASPAPGGAAPEETAGHRVRQAMADGADSAALNDMIRQAPADERAEMAAAVLGHDSFREGDTAALTAAVGGPAALEEAQGIARTEAAASDAAASAVSASLEVAEAADTRVAEAQAQLDAELAGVSGALGPEDTARYTEAFWDRPENQGLRETAESTRDALAETLRENEAALERVVEGAEGEDYASTVGDMLLDSHEILARDPEHAEQARDFVASVADPASAAHVAVAGQEHRLDGILADGAQARASEVLAQEGGTPQAAYEAASGYLGALSDVAGVGEGITEALGTLDRVAAGDAAALRAFASADAPDSMGRLGGIAALAGMASSVAGVAGASSTQEMAAAVAEGVGAGMEFAAGFLQSGATTGGSRALAGALLESGGKVAGAIGGLINTVGHVQDAMGPGGTRWDTVAAVASAVSVAAAFVPGAGTLVSAGAALVATAAGNQGDASREDTLRDNTRRGLADIGYDMTREAVDELFDAPGAVASLAERGCSPDYIRGLAQRVGNTDHSLASLASTIPSTITTQPDAERIVRWALGLDASGPGSPPRGPH